MEIIKQGEKRKITDDKKRFDCTSCGCAWIASPNEYIMTRTPIKPNCFCWCPNCNNQTWENNSDSTSEMTLEEAYRHIKASYIHHNKERNATFLPQAEAIAMDCIMKVIDAQKLEQCIVEHDISFDAFCIYCQDLLNSAKERLERTLSYGETSKYRISELKSAIRLQEQLLGYMTELKEAKQLLKIALDDMNTLYESGKDEGCLGIKFKWRYEDEVMKLLGDDKDVSIDEN